MALQEISVDTVIRLMPFMYGVLWGCFAAVFFNAVDASSDTLRGFIGVLTALTGAGLGLWGSRTLSERTAERDRRQRILADVLRVEGLHHSLSLFLEHLSALQRLPGDDRKEKVEAADRKMIREAGSALLALMVDYEDVPTFIDAIETQQDHRRAHSIKSGFRWLERSLRKYKEASDTLEARRDELARCLTPVVFESLERLEEALARNAKYFRAKLPTQPSG